MFSFSCNNFKSHLHQCIAQFTKALVYISECGSGSFRDSQFICQDCGLGTFQTEEEQLFCQSCPADTTTLNTGTEEMADCKSKYRDAHQTVSTLSMIFILTY